MRVYIAGPMTGYPERNYPAFEEAARVLRESGSDVVSPHELECEQDSWQAWMIVDIKAMLDCDMIVTLDGWEKSKGASLEVHIGKALDKPVVAFAEYAIAA